MTPQPPSAALWGSSFLAGGIGLGGGFWFIKWLIEFVGGRMERKAERLDRTTEALLTRLENEIGELRSRLEKAEADLQECKEKHAESEAKVMQIEAIMQGYGDARQAAARIVAEEKRKG